MGKFRHLFLAIVAVAGLLLGGCGDDDTIIPIVSTTGKFLFVNNNSSPNFVSGFAIKSDGSLEHLAGSPFATGGAALGIGSTYYAGKPIALAPRKKLLFAANRGDSTITAFVLNTGSGELTAVGTPVASGGTMGPGGSLAVDDDENFLFVANADTSDISVFAIASNGGLTPVAAPFSLGVLTSANGMTMNAVGTVLYVALPDTNSLAVLSVSASGALAHIAGSPFLYTAGGEIESFALASSSLGLSGATNGTIASYGIDAIGAPTLLDSVNVGVNSQCVSTARNGKLAFLAGGVVSNISVLQVAVDGTLTPVVGSPFATAAPSYGYAIAHPKGKFVYATETTQIEAFAIDAAGALTSINVYPLTNPGNVTSGVIY